MIEGKFLVLCRNVAHPYIEFAFFLAYDEDENTIVFDTEEEAKAYIKTKDNGLFAFVILPIDKFEYE